MSKFQRFLMEKRVVQLVEAMENMSDEEILTAIENMDDESYSIFEAVLQAQEELTETVE